MRYVYSARIYFGGKIIYNFTNACRNILMAVNLQ